MHTVQLDCGKKWSKDDSHLQILNGKRILTMRLQFITKLKSAFDISVKLAYINKYTIKNGHRPIGRVKGRRLLTLNV